MKKISNPPNPFHSQSKMYLEPPTEARLEVYEDKSRRILSRNDSPDLSFTWSLNPYRGCFHSCAYCYAREYHEYLDMGAGTDFESKIAIKKDAPSLLAREFKKPSWKGELIVFSGATDCYQPLEAVYELTRQCLEICLDYRNPVGIITKSFLITRDIDLLEKLHRESFCSVIISIPFMSEEDARVMEPQASTLARRFEAVRKISERGIPVGISLAPTIPGLNDQAIPSIMKQASECGATFAFHTLVRLSGSVFPVFEQKIKTGFSKEKADRVLNRLTETREGNITDGRFGYRMKGEGVYWKSIHDMFQLSKKKYGLNRPPHEPVVSPFRRPKSQLELNLVE